MANRAALLLAISVVASSMPGHASTQLEESNWIVKVDQDPFSGRVNASASLGNANGDVISINCNGSDKSILSIQYRPKRYLGSSDNIVTLKIGEFPLLPSLPWVYLSKGAYTIDKTLIDVASLQFSNGEQAILVRALNYEGQPVDARFASSNAKFAINKVRVACGDREL
jgi:hypothetical protein